MSAGITQMKHDHMQRHKVISSCVSGIFSIYIVPLFFRHNVLDDISAIKRRSSQLDAPRMRCFSTKSIGLICQDIQHRTFYGNRSTHPCFQRMNRTEMSNRNDLPCGMCMLFI